MKIKICGITRLEDALCAVEHGADMLGFIFYQKSKRYISPENAAEIITGIPGHIETVGVFVNAASDELISVAETSGITTMQLHGDEDESILPALSKWQIIKAFALKDVSDLAKLDTFQSSRILIDSVSAEHGGSGIEADWNLASAAAKKREIILAGGLNAGNIEAAIRLVNPYGIDLSSGLEKEPGIKDPEKIKLFALEMKNL
ncbi:MAG: phosphoribosylanthranilate isomerase [Lentisphaeria bacterium]|nr:phosphoribosylanthranilate isomerase [Lentisphaeria bacterium]